MNCPGNYPINYPINRGQCAPTNYRGEGKVGTQHVGPSVHGRSEDDPRPNQREKKCWCRDDGGGGYSYVNLGGVQTGVCTSCQAVDAARVKFGGRDLCGAVVIGSKFLSKVDYDIIIH